MSDESKTLWEHCFAIEVALCIGAGEDTLQFDSVDRLVVQLSRQITEYGTWPTIQEVLK